MLQIDHINKTFGDRQVLRDVTFGVASGEIVGLLGANGAGKTTLLRIVTRLLPPDSGSILFDNHPMVQDDLRQIGYLPEERGLYPRMPAGEQARYFMQMKGLGRGEAERTLHEWFQRLEMDDWWQRPAGRLSKGMQQRLQFVITVAHHPRLIILDEPFSGLDTAGSTMLKREVERLKAQGAAILLSTHNLQAASELCDKTIEL